MRVQIQSCNLVGPSLDRRQGRLRLTSVSQEPQCVTTNYHRLGGEAETPTTPGCPCQIAHRKAPTSLPHQLQKPTLVESLP